MIHRSYFFYHLVKYYHISAEKRETGMSSSNVVEQRFFHLESVSRFCTREWEAALMMCMMWKAGQEQRESRERAGGEHSQPFTVLASLAGPASPGE